MNKASFNLTNYVNSSMLHEDALLQFCHTVYPVVFHYYLLNAYYVISSLLNSGNTVVNNRDTLLAHLRDYFCLLNVHYTFFLTNGNLVLLGTREKAYIFPALLQLEEWVLQLRKMRHKQKSAVFDCCFKKLLLCLLPASVLFLVPGM